MKRLSEGRFHTYMFLLLSIINSAACTKLAEVGPPVTSTTGQSVYSENATAAAVLSGIYAEMSSGNITSGSSGISARCGLSADELVLFNGSSNVALNLFYKNTLSSQQDVGPWIKTYKYLHTVNSAIEGLSASESLTSSVKKQLLGEAKFLRAFFHFYLVNLYGDVPLVTSSSYTENASKPRMPVVAVYQQIIKDLKEAKELLSDRYLSGDALSVSEDRVRPTKWAAMAMLARVYLFVQDWAGAEAQATEVISNSQLFTLEPDLDKVFLMNSREAIWQLMPVEPEWNTLDARLFILLDGPNDWENPVFLSPFLMDAFEIGDQRKQKWVANSISSGATFYYPYKYKSAVMNEPVTEYLMVLRLAELYLIRAEARARQSNVLGSVADLNTVRSRSRGVNSGDLPDRLPTISQEQAISYCTHERRVELFTEWGHRWLDLKRLNKIDEVMSQIAVQKGTSWQSSDRLYPLPFDDIRLNQALVQNPGY